VLVGQAVAINRTGSYGFLSSDTADYQLVAIPVTAFAIPIGQVINQIRITAFGSGHGFFIGDISFQEEGATQQPGGITLAQAEALFAAKGLTFLTASDQTVDLPNSRELLAGTGCSFDDATPGERTLNITPSTGQAYTIGITVDGGGSAITTGVKGYRSIPVTGNITKVRLLADQDGDAVVDLWLKDPDGGTDYPPTVADTITASAKPTLSTADFDEDTTLTGWTVAVTAGDVMAFNIDSAATIERLIVEVEITP
jgi:hypothetical protein